MIKASYFERIVRKAKDLKYCHCESADKQAKQSRIQYNDRLATCFFLVCSDAGKGSQHLIFEVDMSNVEI